MNYIKIVAAFFVAVLLNGCVSSYKDVKPGYIPNSKNEEYIKDVKLELYQNTTAYKSITIDAKIASIDGDYLLGKLNANKKIYFRYVSDIKTSRTSNVSISQRSYVPVGFKDIEKLRLPVYISGVNVFDLNDKGNFAYISNKKTVKVLNQLNIYSLKRLINSKNAKDKNIRTLNFRRAVKQIAFQKNSNRLIAVLDNNSIEIWDYKRAKRVRTLASRYKGNIDFIKISNDGKYLISSSSKKTLLWNLKTYKYSTFLQNTKLFTSDISKDSKRIAFSTEEGKILVYDLLSKKQIVSFSHKHVDNLYGVVFSPINNNTLITAGQDGLIKAWDLSDTSYQIFTKYNKYRKSKVCNANAIKNEYFLIKSDSLKKFESKYNPKMNQCNILGDKEQIINYSNRGVYDRYLTSLVGTLLMKYKSIKKEWVDSEIVNPTTDLRADYIEYIKKHGSKEVRSYSAGHFNQRELVGSITPEQYQDFLNTKKVKSKIAKINEKNTKEYTTLIAHMNGGAVYGLVSAGEKILPFGSGFQEAYSYHHFKGGPRTAYGVQEYRFDFSKYLDDKMYEISEKDIFKTGYSNYDEVLGIEDQKLIAVKDNIIELWDYKNKKLISNIAENGTIYALAYDEKSNIVAVGLSNHKIKLWDIKNKKSLGELVGHKGNIISLAFAKGGKQLISGAADETVLIWDMKKRKSIKQLTGFKRAASRIEIDPKERILSVVSVGQMNSDILFYDLNSFKLIKKISPEMGTVKDTEFIKNGKEFLAVSSGNYSQRANGHVYLTMDMKTFKTSKGFYNAPYMFTRGMSIDEANDKFYIAGSDDTFVEFELSNPINRKKLYNMGYDDRKASSISAVGTTKEKRMILANKLGYISIGK